MIKNDVLLIVGRDDWQKDKALNVALLNLLKKNNIEIIWEDPGAEIIYFFRKHERHFVFLPQFIKKCNLRIAQLLYMFVHPSYFFYLYKKKKDLIVRREVISRSDALKKLIHDRRISERTTILSRSSGGRISSLIADELNLKHIICLGYPFKHPDQNDEPARYSHLKTLKTSMLIIQGIHDEYGGLDVKDKYILSENIKLVFFDTNHNFDITDEMAHDVVKEVETFVKFKKKNTF